MLIPVVIEPNYRSSIWAQQTLSGLSQEAARRKYRCQLIDGDDYRAVDYDALFGQEKRMVIIAGTSITWMPEALAFFSERGIATVFISFDPHETVNLQGLVRMDYVSAIHMLLSYLQQCGRSRIALYGFNPNSSADSLKLRYFELWNQSHPHAQGRNVFPNLGTLSECYAQFHALRSQFDAVICANDIVAVSFLQALRRDGISVPEELYVATFGDSLLARRVKPSITCASLDHCEMGRQAVNLYAYICRQKASTNISVRVQSQLLIRQSTAMTPFDAPAAGAAPVSQTPANVDFYSDGEVRSLLLAEQMLAACDQQDEALIRCIVRGESLETLEAELYLSADALKYRRKRLMNLLECKTTAELKAFLEFCQNLGLF